MGIQLRELIPYRPLIAANAHSAQLEGKNHVYFQVYDEWLFHLRWVRIRVIRIVLIVCTELQEMA